MRHLALLLAAAAVAAGCAAPRPAVFAVIPDQADGHVGTIVVEANGEKRVVHEAYGAQRILPDGRVVGEKLDAKRVRDEFGPTLAALPPHPTTFTLYFEHDSDELTAQSQAELGKVFAELKRRPLPDIVVTGYTDTVGGLTHNDQLSRARAERMRELLVDKGLPRERIAVEGRGKRQLLIPTEDNVAEPRNRRVEISVR